jgi:Flp pilus assembly protein TadD
MPKAAGRGVNHSSYTDHSIPRTNASRTAPLTSLTSFFPNAATPRDTALALAILNRFPEAQPLLEAAIQSNPTDIAALSQLAQIYDRQGRELLARPLYESILKLDPNHATAATNLAVILVKSGNLNQAIALWRQALKVNPAQTGVRMNLAQALFRQGNRQAAAAEIDEALKFDPDQPAARRLLKQLRP